MSSDRERFLERVRKAVAEGNQAGRVPPLPERGAIAYQGSGEDPLEHFRAELTAVGGQVHVVPDCSAAVSRVLALVQDRGARRVLLSREPFLDSLPVGAALRTAGVEVIAVESLTEGQQRAPFFAADLGITGVDYLIGETGSVVLRTRPDQPRSVSLLPPVHVAVAHRKQILPDLFDLFEKRLGANQDGLPASLSLITGPSKTGDIELRLVTGVHGPGEIHVVVVDS